MKLSPQTVQKLMSDVPEIREFITYIEDVAATLNEISDIKTGVDPIVVATEVAARQLAYQKLQEILKTLLESDTPKSGNSQTDDYAV